MRAVGRLFYWGARASRGICALGAQVALVILGPRLCTVRADELHASLKIGNDGTVGSLSGAIWHPVAAVIHP